jgi:hypothetical protein
MGDVSIGVANILQPAQKIYKKKSCIKQPNLSDTTFVTSPCLSFFSKTRGRKDRDNACDETKLYLQVSNMSSASLG